MLPTFATLFGKYCVPNLNSSNQRAHFGQSNRPKIKKLKVLTLKTGQNENKDKIISLKAVKIKVLEFGPIDFIKIVWNHWKHS